MENGNRYKVSSSPGDKMTARREFCCAQLFGVFLFIVGLVAGVLIGIYVYHGGADGEVTCKGLPDSMNPDDIYRTTSARSTRTPTTQQPHTTSGSSENVCHTCKRHQVRTEWDDTDPEIFAPLTPDEMRKVYNFLLSNQHVDQSVKSLKSNYVLYMYLALPEKEAVRKYKTGRGPYPGRYAEIHVVRGNRTVPDYMEYKIGPLDAETMSIEQRFEDGKMVYNSRPYDYIEEDIYRQILAEDFKVLEPLTKESFDGAHFPGPNGEISIFYYNGPPGYKGEERETRFVAYLNPFKDNPNDIVQLDFLPLSGTIHCPGNDESTWHTYDYYYLNQGPFPNASALMEAYDNGILRKFTLPNGYRKTLLDRLLPDRDTNAPFRRNSNMPPPRTYEPDGPRYTINGHTVDWMGWNFDITSFQLRGPSLFEITFLGKSIAYEISTNEIGVIYGSGASAQTNIIYADSQYGIGEALGIVKSVDCPEHATMLETTHWDSYSSTPNVHRSICVFEADGENALWRHKGWDFEGGLRNNYLVVRFSVTIGNYDYIIEWHFYLDGKIYTIVSASGYIQGAFWDDENPFMGNDKSRDSFGFRLNSNTHGQIHDHMIGFKVDLDILGTENTMETIHWKTGDVVTALCSQVPSVNNVPPYFLHNITRYVDYEVIDRETGYRVNLDKPKFWIVKNENETNKWGAQKGYQIKPISTASQTITDAHPSMPALSFSKYHCAVTKRKESEQYMSSTTDSHRLDKPIADLEKQLNNEYIRNTDIVNWVTVGFQHVPTAEDLPMTIRAESGFMLKPFNFFDKTPVFDIQAYLDTRSNWRTERPPLYTPCLEGEP